MTPYMDVLPATAYLGAIPSEPKPGKMALTHPAMIRLRGRPRRCYAKVYAGPHARQQLAHEILGYCLFRAAGVPVASHAAVMPIASAVLRVAHPHAALADGVHWAFVTTDLTSPQPPRGSVAVFLLNDVSDTAIHALAADLAQWPRIGAVLSIDEWSANVDRNLGNLFRYHRRHWAVFDHGELLSGAGWLPPRARQADSARTLQWQATYPTKLLRLFRDAGLLQPAVCDAMLCEAAHAEARLDLAYPQFVRFAIELLSQTEFATALSFLDARAKHAERHQADRVDHML